jgi:hypothetical protein
VQRKEIIPILLAAFFITKINLFETQFANVPITVVITHQECERKGFVLLGLHNKFTLNDEVEFLEDDKVKIGDEIFQTINPYGD